MPPRFCRSIPWLLVAFCFTRATGVGWAQWPQFRGPTGDGHGDGTALARNWSETRNIVWKTPIHGRGWSSPVILGEQIWMTTATEGGQEMFAVAVERASGRVVHNVKVFEIASPREIHALNSYASCTPVVEAGRVYVHFGSYGTACLNTDTAEVLWTRTDLPCDHFRGPGSSPIVYENFLIVHYDGADFQYVVALDKRSGSTAWRTDRSNDFGTDDGDFKKAFSTPLVVEVEGRPLLISPGSKACMAYDPDTGEEIWQVRFDQFSSTARPLFGHGLAFINTGFSKAQLWAVRPDGRGDVTQTHVVWQAKRGIPSKPSPLLVEDLIFMVDDMGIASCIEASTGEQVWVERLGGEFSASPIYCGGLIYAADHDGRTYVLRPARRCDIVAVNQLDEGCMASPAATVGELYLRTKGHLYRIEDRGD